MKGSRDMSCRFLEIENNTDYCSLKEEYGDEMSLCEFCPERADKDDVEDIYMLNEITDGGGWF